MSIENTLCEECNSNKIELLCKQCEEQMCKSCFEHIHRGGKRKDHTKVILCAHCEETGNIICRSCSVNICDKCKHKHTDHTLSSNSNQNTTSVYWDLHQSFPTQISVSETVEKFKILYPNIRSIKAYIKENSVNKDVFSENGIEVKVVEHYKDLDSMLFDISVEHQMYSGVFIISSRPQLFKQRLMKILENFPMTDIKVSVCYENINPVSVDQIPSSTENKPFFLETDNKPKDKEVYKLTRRRIAASEDSLETCMISYLKDQASKGILTYEINELAENIKLYLKITYENALDLIKTGARLGKLTHQCKKIGSNEFDIISLKIEKIDEENLLWVLKSLQHDEMIPTEKAIQSRIKEAFDLKITPSQWNYVLQICCKSQKFKTYSHTKASSESSNFLFFSDRNLNRPRKPYFIVKSIKDPVTGCEISVIYPNNDEWVSYDQHIKSGDVFKVKSTEIWKSFIEFFNEYFSTENPEEQAIGGGRYGCAQFLKFCGNTFLKKSSLGKLSYMIQLAIDEDLLRYHKTLLMWIPALDTKSKEDTQELYFVKKALIQVLLGLNDGVSLAQLPLHLKEKLSFDLDLSKIGFTKLKDLILTIPEAEIISKGKNHPFARLKKIKYPSAETLSGFILSKLSPNIHIKSLEYQILENYGYSFDWSIYKSKNFEDFIVQSSDFIINGSGYVIKRPILNKKLSNSVNNPYTWNSFSYPNPDDLSNDLDTPKHKDDCLEKFAEMQNKYIQQLLDEDDLSSSFNNTYDTQNLIVLNDSRNSNYL